MAAPVLALTGERTAPGVWHENYWFRRHQAAYAALPGWVPRPPSLSVDAGSGEGYGVALLGAAFPGCNAIGIDYDAAATAHAARTYAGPRAAYLRGALTGLPLPDACADLVVSLQVLEHIWTPAEYVRELARVCRPGATVVLTTPNRLTFSPGLGRRERPANAYHCREYDIAELVGELGHWTPELSADRVLGVHAGPRLLAWERENGALVGAQQARAPEAWGPALAGMVRQVRADDFAIGPDDLDASLDLVLVARRVG